ncbi:unnamed protein product [Pleuronectes platessa]|uniref:MIF4G domain-containing protein n=1 Tax=Pleuronectes platessa TaxID=8262 RepID=A0A9N7YL88_PLEPL|nr:unnamed protein product [Pleuronectes platessa]
MEDDLESGGHGPAPPVPERRDSLLLRDSSSWFIWELFLSKVLSEKAMHCCIKRLLQKGDGSSLEGLCQFLQLIQQDLEVVTSKEVMDSYYNQLDFIAEKGKRAPRLSLLLKHTADSRK